MLKRFIFASLAALVISTGAIAAGTLTLLGFGPASSGPPAMTYTYNSTTSVTPVGNVSTFNSFPIGSADPSRVVYLPVFCSGGTGQSGGLTMTVNGVAATFISVSFGSPNTTYISAWWASVPTGTTANVVVTNGVGNNTFCALTSWSIYNAQNSAPLSSSQSTANPSTALNDNNQPSDVASFYLAGAGACTSTSITGTPVLTTRFDTTIGGACYGAADRFNDGNASQPTTISRGGTGTPAVAFRPRWQ